MSNHNDLKEVALKLLAYCRSNSWAGYDPYDAVNSRAFAALPFLNARLPRLVFTQALKRTPFNIRRLLLIPKTQNPKAIALFLSAFLKLSRIGMPEVTDHAEIMINRLIALRSQDLAYWCWGYSFPWQTRTIVVPAGTPNLVCTTFVADALLDAYEQRGEKRCLNMAASTAQYILDELYWSMGTSFAGFSYPLPNLRTQVHNANFLASALLCRVYKHTGESKFLAPALRVARYAATKQRMDGSWLYGEGPSQGWIDNFHTGYNLCALHSIDRSLETNEFESHIQRGFQFYRAHFFRDDGAPRYFHNRDFPIDIHCVAQSIITLVLLRDLDPDNVPLARSVLEWALDHMWDKDGFFYYRVQRFYTNRIPYMRWAQAWMLLAISSLLCDPSGAFTESGTFRLDSHKAGMLTASGAYGGPAFLTV
jgi:hypothetical protein